MRVVVAWITVALATIGTLSAQTTGPFLTVTLPRDVSVEVPKNWVFLSNNQRVTLDASVQSRLDLSRISLDPSHLPFAANLYDEAGNTIAMANARYYSGVDISQDDARAATASDISELDAALETELRRGMRASGMSISSWSGTRRKDINGFTAFVSEYRRPSSILQGDFRVRLVRVFAGDTSFTLTVSYWERQAHLLEPIADRIIESLQMAGATSESSSPMTPVFGDPWLLVLIASALLTWGIGLAPPLAIRFGIVRRPVGKGPALAIVGVLWLFNLILFTAMGSQNRTHGALALVALASYAILRKRANRVAPSHFE